MKKLLTILVPMAIGILLAATVWAQSPEKMTYQAVIRDASDNLVTDTQIGMQISILQGSASGTAVYVETQEPSTNANGLVSIEIGSGTVESGDFTTIEWANGPYFIKTETAVETPLTTYTITGTSQLLSVPYALHAKTAETVTGAITETDPTVPTGTQAGEMQYWDGTEWITVAAGSEGQMLSFVGGVPTWITTVGPTDVYNPATGKIWMDRNLGASQVATNSTDADAYGDLYQWGRAADGHESRTSSTTSTLATSDTPGHSNFITIGSSPYDWRNPQNDNLWQGINGTNNPCPSGYRLPTEAEWEAERASWSSNNAAGAFDSPLKLPVAGNRSISDGSLLYVGYDGLYWSCTVSITAARFLSFDSSNAYMNSHYRARGFSVRCLKD
jgi:uncharacterized protein (TIGR02145 family)